MDKKLSDALDEVSESIKQCRDLYDRQNDVWWNSLSQDEREYAFYAVVKRIRKAELDDRRSFRGVLYGEFGFGTEMYGVAMDAGYMELHNALFDGEEFMSMSTANALEVVGPDNTTVSWPDVENLTITANDGKVTIEINKGNPYV